MKILVINCGSSSIKYKLFFFPSRKLLDKGIVERIGEKDSGIKNHSQALRHAIGQIQNKNVIENLTEIKAIGHRVVHGGEFFRKPHLINKKTLEKIKKCSNLAPLHNPANLAGIEGCRNFFPTIPQIAVFDTAFHQSIPEAAYMYAIPIQYYKKYKIRRYGFHGTSHQFIAQQAAGKLSKPLNRLKIITCHLGNGCSVTAINKGKVIDTSMGFTPLEGLMMGTRCGDVDVAAILHIMNKKKLSPLEMGDILNKQSGLLGISRVSNDFRLILKALKAGSKPAKLAYEMFIYRIKKYIGVYTFILGRADAVVLTGGIGENSKRLFKDLNKDIKDTSKGKTKLLVIPTDEELMIAIHAYKLIKNHKRSTQ